MDQLEIYVTLLCTIAGVCWVFRKEPIPMPLILVIAGMFLSFLPFFPEVNLKPELVLDVFLPLLIYATTIDFSWPDVKNNIGPILLLSNGHVLFITLLVAVTVHAFIPEIGWPMAFVLGAVISPPDDVAIVPIAKKLNLPNRIVTILKGEGLLNDAFALILFRFSLVAVITHQFSAIQAFSSFLIIVIGETFYGLFLGNVIGEIRLKIKDPMLQILISITTPFLAYLPTERLGGCGVLATAVTGFVISYRYVERFPTDVRIIGRPVWATITFVLDSILFLLVGLNFHHILERISSIPFTVLLNYSVIVISAVILGRFAWVFGTMYLPKYLPFGPKKEYYPWQGLFVVSWAGMRGSISLAAAFAVPILPNIVSGANARDLLIFLVFSVIVATLLIQGMTLPWLIKVLNIKERGDREHYDEHLQELHIRLKLTKVVLRWLNQYIEDMHEELSLHDELKLHIQRYKMLERQLNEQIKNHDSDKVCMKMHDENLELKNSILIVSQIIEVERSELIRLGKNNQISYAIKNKLLQQLDYLTKNIT